MGIIVVKCAEMVLSIAVCIDIIIIGAMIRLEHDPIQHVHV